MTISLQYTARHDFDLALTHKGNVVTPLTHRSPADAERPSDCGSAAKEIDSVLNVHGVNSTASHTVKSSHTRPVNCYQSRMKNINDRIREAVNADSRTQVEIAAACGVTKATVNDWMQGRTRNIRPENLFALADALGVSARWLATGKGPRIDPLKTPAIKVIADVLCYASVPTQNAVANMVKQIAEEKATYNKD